MEICDLEETAFVQYKPSSVTWPRPSEFDVTFVPRDRDWFESVLPKLYEFWVEMKRVQAAAIADPTPYLPEPVTTETTIAETVRPKKRRCKAIPCAIVDDLYTDILVS